MLRTNDGKAAADAGLVLTAVGIESSVEHDGLAWCVFVGAAFAERAATELARYREENVPTPPRPRFVPVDSGWYGVFGFWLVIWALPMCEASLAFGWDWREIGSLRSEAVRDGEWWRTITALTLHGDLAHILANSAFGTVFGVFVGRLLGSGVGWLLIVLASALGNGIDAAVQGDGFVSIGASTAVFAALGMSGAFVWRRGTLKGLGLRRTAAPMFAAFALLAYTGVGDEHVDVVAHFAGFACGAIAGISAAFFRLDRARVALQTVCGAAAIAAVVCAWLLAGTASN